MQEIELLENRRVVGKSHLFRYKSPQSGPLQEDPVIGFETGNKHESYGRNENKRNES
jgi:hypothetical protein